MGGVTKNPDQMNDLAATRMALVEEHIRLENAHDLDGVLRTYAPTGRYDDEPYDEHHEGLGAVRAYYDRLMTALPDLRIDVERRHVGADAVVVECTISGTHLGTWRGLPPTGRRVRFSLCAVYTFDGDRFATERIYYDRATVLRQVGVFWEPERPWGRVLTAIMHPVTIGRALSRARSGDR